MQGQCLQAGIVQKLDKSEKLQQWLKQWPPKKRGYLVVLSDCDQHPQQDWINNDEQVFGTQGTLAVMKFRNRFIPIVNNGRSRFKSYPVKLEQGRLVFQDQKKQVSCLIPKNNFRFEHAPLEQCQNDPELKKLSRWLYALPPEPGEEGLSGLVGIDLDQDGIRDDVQRFIGVIAQDEPAEVKEAINKVAIIGQQELANAYDETTVLALFPQAIASFRCYLHRTKDDRRKYRKLRKEIEAKLYNTYDRLKAKNQINSYFGGMTISRPDDYEAQCNFQNE
ncbi:hypothetical protein [Endozoicomonas sp. GU-1]|uniref:hypothetical protein n=1 Tax=Endozoicomonas sp. GU-1 TaxID=3009078 RepID=UPI0022B3C7E1|nr:hypothetical protein [Endozoicomonas sp. GU-1]WBA88013.1 hypothetical protein O3276_08425 [Endozoicomonas sp. GU-1]